MLKLIILLLFSITVQIECSYYFCDQKSFQSIFTLGEQTYFKNRYGLWVYDGIHLFYNHEFSPYVNIQYEEFLKKEITTFTGFDWGQHIMGMTFKYYSEVCKNTVECNEIYHGVNEYEGCFYGYIRGNKKLAVKAFKYNDHKVGEIKIYKYRDNSFELMMQKECDNWLQKYIWYTNRDPNSVSISRYVNNETVILFGGKRLNVENNETEYLFQYHFYNSYNFDKRKLLQTRVEEEYVFDGYFYLRSLHAYYGYYNTSKHLTRIHHLNNETIVRKAPSLQSLFKCKITKNEIMNRFEFCHQNKFDTVFSLGDQIYLQNDGKFWRFNSWTFMPDINPKNGQKVQPSIRYDTDIVRILKNSDFLFNQRIVGFTFNFWNDYCDSGQKECHSRLKNPNYYRACIYGNTSLDLGVGPKSRFSHHMAVMYGPAGLEYFQNHDIEVETIIFCQQIITKANIEILVSGVGFREKSKKSTTFILVSDRHKQTEFVFLHKISVNDDWSENNKDAMQVIGQTEIHHRNELYGVFNFILNDWDQSEQYYYGFPLTADTKISPHVSHIDSDNLRNIDEFFSCPFNTKFPLMHKTSIGHICDKKSLTSAFNVGQYVYFQYKQHFWRFNPMTNKVKYDVYFTDLMHDYFDTSRAVFGYSYMFSCNETDYCSLIGNSDYRDIVVMIGTSNKLQDYLQSIFVVFKYNPKTSIIRIVSKYQYLDPIIGTFDMPFDKSSNTLITGSVFYNFKNQSNSREFQRLVFLQKFINGGSYVYKLIWRPFDLYKAGEKKRFPHETDFGNEFDAKGFTFGLFMMNNHIYVLNNSISFVELYEISFDLSDSELKAKPLSHSQIIPFHSFIRCHH